ncbi:MAG: pyrimidine dimer DNA glycosylase/endonuclease V [Candidatus Omnitrophica bacterium]|nr:pyrimidine dimer DNA glycosylase/endonuclease V [Candidatus Omnitrophota bacterium]
MRLWSIHPQYLDKKGLLAVWREGLLAKRVLEGKTKGYRSHPQLVRFKNYKNSIVAIDAYLFEIYKEAKKRRYNFDRRKIKTVRLKDRIPVTSGQIEFEFRHLIEKLKSRDKEKYKQIKLAKKIKIHPIFLRVPGEKEVWERSY